MTPDTQQKCLKRFLTVQPMTGWPAWTDSTDAALELRPSAYNQAAVWSVWGHRADEEDWCECEAVYTHNALCIVEHHLLGWLGERAGLGNMRVWCDKHVWAIATPECMTIDGPSLMEALLGTCEHIQQLIKEQSDA